MSTIKRTRRTETKRTDLFTNLWKDVSTLFSAADAPPAAPAPATERRATVRRRATTRRRRAEPTPVPNAPAEVARGQRVLAIDDDEAFLELIRRLLRSYDLVVETAVGPDAGLLAARRGPPAVFIIDYEMPGLNGFEFIERLRHDDSLASVPRIVLANAARAETLREALRFEALKVLVKPVGKADLVAALEQALGGRIPEGRIRREQTPVPIELQSDQFAVAPASPKGPPPPPPQAAEEKADSFAIRFSASRKEENPGESPIDAVEIEGPAVKAVSSIIRIALIRKASDIHVEPMATNVQVRLRVDGEMATVLSYPSAVAPAIAARFKVMSNLDIAEKRLPQDGRLTVEAGDKNIDFRVSTLPSLFGEKLVLRVIGGTKVDGDLSKLGLDKDRLATVRWGLAQPNGLILLTGPTGSGKTTTLYRMLSNLNNGKRNIVTVEDPIEGQLEGITQVAVHPDIGLTFEKALRAFLRQDPDVMLVGEIRDAETAEIAARAALTGRLILSTLHTNDSVSSIQRLAGMKVPGYMIAATVRLVIAQRLVRLLCPKCRREDAPNPSERDALAAGGRPLEKLWRAAGCGECMNVGFSGRAPVLEILAIRSTEIRELIREQAPADVLRRKAIEEGMMPLARAALELVADGRTSFEEALRAAALD